MELRHYWRVIQRFLWMIVIVTVVATLTSAYFSFKVIKPTYDASTTLLLNQKLSSPAAISADYNDIMTNEALVQTYSDIIQSNTVLIPVITSLNLPYKPSTLSSMITVTSNNQSEVMSIDVKDHSIQQAVAIANSVASVFQQRVVQLMQVQNVQIVDPAVVPSNPIPVSPRKSLNIAIAFILGLMVSAGIAFLFDYLDDSVRSEEDVSQILGVTILAVIPMVESRHKKDQVTQVSSPSATL